MAFTFFIGVVILLLVLNLRGRVKKIELLIKTGKTDVTQSTPGLRYQTPSQQSVAQQPESSDLLEYIKKQLNAGVGEDAIKSTLIGNGWQVADIEKGFSSIMSSTQISQPAVTSALTEPTLFDKFGAWLKEDWLMKLGALLLLIGFGWLTTFAFLNNWIGPMGRIALGIVAGALFILLGWWRIKKYIHQGGIFLVLGSTIILLTIFAAREIYDFFTPVSALLVMFLSTAFVALASVKYNNHALAQASLILAGIAPMFTNSPTNYVGLFSYLLVVILGAIWIVALTGRRELTITALILITLYSFPHLFYSTSIYTGTLLLFAYAFAGVFFLTNTVGILKSKGKEFAPDLLTAAGNGLLLLAWIMTAAQDEWKSLIISAWMIVFAVGAFLIFRITQKREPFYVYAGVGIAMLAAATSAELKGATLTIAYTIESGIISLVAYYVLRDIRISQRISLLLVWPIILSFGSITSRAWGIGIFHKHFFVLLILGLTLLGLGLFFLRRSHVTGDNAHATLLTVGSVYAFVLLWLSLHAILQNNNTAVMISLVIYTIVGLIAYFYGLSNERRGLRIYGGVLVGLVVGRLLLVDIWGMDIAGRIVTFFLIGTLLVSTAFLGKKRQNKAISDNT